MKKRKTLQRVSLIAGYACYAAAVLTLFAAGFRGLTNGTDNPVFASLLASLVFFIGSGVVLHVIGAVNLPWSSRCSDPED